MENDKKLDEIHATVTELRQGQDAFKDSIVELTYGQKEMSKHIGDMAEQARSTNGRLGALETVAAVRAGVEKSNAKMYASVLAGAALLIAAVIGAIGVLA